MATGYEQDEPIRQDAADCALPAWLGRGRPGSLFPPMPVLRPRVRRRLSPITGAPEPRQPVKEGLYWHAIIKSLCRIIHDQGHEVIDGRFVRREKGHAEIIGYDDVNQLFWYPEGIARIVLNDNASPLP